MTTIEDRAGGNLEELRRQLTARLALALLIVNGALAWVELLVWSARNALTFRRFAPFPGAYLGLFATLSGLGLGVHILIVRHPAAARRLLAGGLIAGLLAAMGLLPAPWLPFLGLPLVFVGAMLVSGGQFAAASAFAAWAAWLTISRVRSYPLQELVAALVLSIGFAWLVVRTLYTALEWAWTMQQRADHLLEEARDRQAELGRVVKSLNLSDAILRRTQRDLIVARRQAEEARKMKEQFAANISHELRTPLNLILGFSEMMYLSPEIYGDMAWPNTLRQDVYQVYRSSRHLLEMIDDVLDLSRFEMVGFTLSREPVSIEPLVREAVEIVGDFFRDRPVGLELEIADDLPMLDIDPTRIRQVLLNLLNNAQRFTERGVVRVEAKRGDGVVVISVSDTGPGIPADELPHLFQEFYQVDRSLRRKHGGTGLGLAISKHFVEAHGGHIWVESAVGVGSVFSFALPIPGETIPLSRICVEHPLEPALPQVRAPIVVVDPDPAVATLIGRRLDQYDVVPLEFAGDLAEAVTLHHPRAVVCNVLPGEQCGCEDAIPRGVPLIECSLPSQAWVANDLGVMAVLTKPVTAESLMHQIRRLEDRVCPKACDVLVVDDDRGFCQLIERALRSAREDLAVRQAYDGDDGLLALRTRRPDLLFLDLMMPGRDGFQVLKAMRQEPGLADVPVVLLTATSLAEDILVRRRGQLVVRRAEGLAPAEVMRCLQAVIGTLEPRYDERSAPEETLTPPVTTRPLGAGHPAPAAG